mmetsp:Transcript_6764/g.18907  ORF Transcript_6764/g.18907 Transcript_6764/m.18907 type:complete len:255 (-) Transcript_6764:809-1573(-)
MSVCCVSLCCVCRVSGFLSVVYTVGYCCLTTSQTSMSFVVANQPFGRLANLGWFQGISCLEWRSRRATEIFTSDWMEKANGFGMNTHVDIAGRRGALERLLQFVRGPIGSRFAQGLLVQTTIGSGVAAKSIHRVGDNGMTKRRAMHVQLMRSSSDACQGQSSDGQTLVAVPSFPRLHLIVRDACLFGFQQFFPHDGWIQVHQCCLMLGRRNPHEGWMFIITHQWQIDESLFLFDVTGDQAFVLSCYFSCAKQRI